MVAEKEDLGSQDESHGVSAGELGGGERRECQLHRPVCVPT